MSRPSWPSCGALQLCERSRRASDGSRAASEREDHRASPARSGSSFPPGYDPPGPLGPSEPRAPSDEGDRPHVRPAHPRRSPRLSGARRERAGLAKRFGRNCPRITTYGVGDAVAPPNTADLAREHADPVHSAAGWISWVVLCALIFTPAHHGDGNAIPYQVSPDQGQIRSVTSRLAARRPRTAGIVIDERGTESGGTLVETHCRECQLGRRA
jgi:hypothetical protein